MKRSALSTVTISVSRLLCGMTDLQRLPRQKMNFACGTAPETELFFRPKPKGAASGDFE